jgi:TPR repeat protein
VEDDNSKNYNKCVELAHQGNADAQFRLGCMYQDGEGVPPNPLRADSWFKKASKQGHPLHRISPFHCIKCYKKISDERLKVFSKTDICDRCATK